MHSEFATLTGRIFAGGRTMSSVVNYLHGVCRIVNYYQFEFNHWNKLVIIVIHICRVRWVGQRSLDVSAMLWCACVIQRTNCIKCDNQRDEYDVMMSFCVPLRMTKTAAEHKFYNLAQQGLLLSWHISCLCDLLKYIWNSNNLSAQLLAHKQYSRIFEKA